MTRAAIYARVSSQAQREKNTIENQLRTLPAFVASQGWTLVDTYVDDGRSAKTGHLEARDGFARLVRDARAARFDVLVVADIDRLTRTDDMRERAEILGPFQRAGIRIVTPTGGELDLRTMLGELYVTLHAIVAAEENRKRAERIKAGKLRAIAEGRKPAGPTPYGLLYSRTTGTWGVDEPAAAIVREIFDRVAGGESCVQIADDLTARDAQPAPREGWSRAGVYRIVRKRTAIGEWEADKARGSVLKVPALVTEQQWTAAQQALIAHGKRGLRRTKHVYLLEGLATCGHCGKPVLIRSQSPARRGRVNPAAYVCRGRKLERACNAKIVQTAELDERVWLAVCDELQQPELINALAAAGAQHEADERDWKADADGYRSHLARLDKVESTIMARFRRGTITETGLDKELDAIARERKMVRDQLATAERAMSNASTSKARLSAASEVLDVLRAALPRASAEQRRALLRELVLDGGIVITGGRARLDLRLVRPEGSSAAAQDTAARPAAARAAEAASRVASDGAALAVVTPPARDLLVDHPA